MRPLRVAIIGLALAFTATGMAPEAWAVGARATPSPPKQVVLPAPPLFYAKYSVEADGFDVGKMRRRVTALGDDTYAIETQVETTGLVAVFKPDKYKEKSIFQSKPKGYLPIEFNSKYEGRYKDVVERLQFDWEKGTVESLRDGKSKIVKVEPGVLDKLMYQVVMQNELSRGIDRFHYQVVDRGKIKKYDLRAVGEETIDTALGKQRTVKIEKGTTTIWCAVDLDYVPVKLEQREDGHVITTHIKTLELTQNAVTGGG